MCTEGRAPAGARPLFVLDTRIGGLASGSGPRLERPPQVRARGLRLRSIHQEVMRSSIRVFPARLNVVWFSGYSSI